MSTDHSDRVDQLQDLEIEYHDRYRRTEAMTNLEIIVQQFQKVLDHSSSLINYRLYSGRILLILHAETEN
jgi:hypothetical protein